MKSLATSMAESTLNKWWPLLPAAGATTIFPSQMWLWVSPRQNLAQRISLFKFDKMFKYCCYSEKALESKMFCRSAISSFIKLCKSRILKFERFTNKRKFGARKCFSCVQTAETWNHLPAWLIGRDRISEVIGNKQQGQVPSSGLCWVPFTRKCSRWR